MLTITELLRKHGVVGKFVEFYGEGVAAVPVANRATIGNMSPEFGSTCAIFPIDDETLTYLRLTGRPAEQVALVEAYAKEQGLWHDPASRRPSVLRAARARPVHRRAVARRAEAPAGPGRADRRQERVPRGARRLRARAQPGQRRSRRPSRPRTRSRPRPTTGRPPAQVTLDDGTQTSVDHGSVVIAAITSCTNTSNPSVMVGAALLARNAVERRADPQAVGQDHARARLQGGHGLLRAGRA